MIDTGQTWGGVPGILGQAGAKIHELIHRPTGFDLLWKNPRVPLRPTNPGPNFDDVWSGGWDELFPTDPACTVGDTTFHDHGDLWHGPWEWEITRDIGDGAEIHLSRDTVALPCRMEKWIGFRARIACDWLPASPDQPGASADRVRLEPACGPRDRAELARSHGAGRPARRARAGRPVRAPARSAQRLVRRPTRHGGSA
jgi:hypothetical protein